MSQHPMGTIQWAGWYENNPRTRQKGTTQIRTYPSGEPLVGFPIDGFEADSFHFDKVLLRPVTMLDFMGGLFFVDALMERGADPVELILPFVPGARQDRMNDAGDFLFTAKSVAKEINARGFRKVTVIDPHSEVTPALIDRCHVIHAHECIWRKRLWVMMGNPPGPHRSVDYFAVISPDSGAEKRAGAVAKRFGIPMLHGWKTRDVATGSITGFGLERSTTLVSPDSPAQKVLVVDDICDGGGTFVGLAAVLKERGLRADLFVSHGLFSQGTSKLLEHYEKLFTTDSIETPLCDLGTIDATHLAQGVERIEVCKGLLEGK
jgi:ribose-phosphate pyrophosphokinase